MAPPGADYREVYAAGRAIAPLTIPEQYSLGRAAIAQGGTYDFQRDVRQEKFYDAYVHAANYAVGMYRAGAGYSLEGTRVFAKLYALRIPVITIAKINWVGSNGAGKTENLECGSKDRRSFALAKSSSDAWKIAAARPALRHSDRTRRRNVLHRPLFGNRMDVGLNSLWSRLYGCVGQKRARRRGDHRNRFFRRSRASLENRDQPEASRPLVFDHPG